MIFYKVTFGPVRKDDLRGEEYAEEIALHHICTLEQYGQACWDHKLFPIYDNGSLCAHIGVHGVHARARKNLPKHGRRHLDELVAYFGSPPRWEILGENVSRRETSWKGAPFLFLHTRYYDYESPLHRGDNGMPIPLYRVPDDVGDRETIYYTNLWQVHYHEFDCINMSCGALEIDAYKQLTVHDSELSREGQELCKQFERITGVPTYYFLMRHWGRRKNEENRKCPSCGCSWRTDYYGGENCHEAGEDYCFWEFRFRCDKCRLVSHRASTDDDERHARIGEWKKS